MELEREFGQHVEESKHRRLDVGSVSHEDPVAASCQLGLHIEPDGTRRGC